MLRSPNHLTLSLAAFAAASAQTATPNSENGRYSFNPVADDVLQKKISCCDKMRWSL